jgi:hypothetical protein
VCRLPPDSPLPDESPASPTPVFSVTRTATELSIVCEAAGAPAGAEVEGGWRALRVAGPLAFELTGVLSSLANPLAAAGVPIFALSTFDTDYLLVAEANLPTALGALRRAGHRVD